MDPFFAASTMVINCDILDPASGQPYNRDPRGIAKKAEAYLKSTGIGDTIFVGPEAEFFVLDDVRFSSEPYNSGFHIDSIELPTNSDTTYEGGNLGHRVRTKGGYFPVPPQRLGAGHARRNARGDGADGRRGREAPSRGRFRSARTRSQVRPADHDGGSHAGL